MSPGRLSKGGERVVGSTGRKKRGQNRRQEKWVNAGMRTLSLSLGRTTAFTTDLRGGEVSAVRINIS